jgi:orotidine-5'-phosphate decarboxylase
MADTARAILPVRNATSKAAERLIVALDVPRVETAREIVNRLGSDVSHYKIGPHLQFARQMAEFADELVRVQRKELFLDFKSVDIGDTIEIAVSVAKTVGVKFITIFGAAATIRAAVRARGTSDLPKILVITLLTDHSEADMQAEFDTKDTLEQFIDKRTKMIMEAGGDGVICSPKEVSQIRAIAGSKLLIVTPGVRPLWWPGNGHKRFGTPSESIRAGADFLVVGRPIIQSDDRYAAARKIIQEIETASTG